MSALKGLIGEGRHAEAWALLLREALYVVDYGELRGLCRAYRRLLDLHPPAEPPVRTRIAVLGGATTQPLEDPLRLMLEALGVRATLHTGEYNTFAREMLDPSSRTAAFAPDIAVVLVTPANIPSWPSWSATEPEVATAVEEVCDHWLWLCRSLHEHTGCEIVLSNFHPLPLRPFGALGARLPGEPNRFLRRVNEALARRLPGYVHLHDVETLASLHGVYRWFDARYWYHAKQPVSFECLTPYVRNIAQVIGALLGRSAKCVALDLDNTLWGGVVGDDGPHGIVIGEGDPEGEAFAEFQRYLLRLKERGVLLAVCSKNEEANALEPFQSRPEMVLRRDDFVAFRANWRSKSENLREIATTLNIGLDAIVFVDDNPVEREQIRQAVPEVRVVELGDDPAGFAAALDRTGWFDIVVQSAEDRERTAMYGANVAREELKASVSDYPSFLRSLEQRAVIAPFEERFLDRITQLTNKTNQFNLTTRRLARAELAAMMDSPGYLTAQARLADRFGDNGLVSVFAARREDSDLWIDLWLMSCRVFSRGLEHLLMNHVVERGRDLGLGRIHGLYLPTPKNRIVKDLYPSLGFVACGGLLGGDHWVLDIERYSPLETTISRIDEAAYESDEGRRA